MANPFRQEHKIIGESGRTYSLKYSMNAVVELEEALRMPISQFTQLAHNFGVREARALLWAGLLHKQKDLTIEQAGDILEDIGLEKASKEAAEALGEALNPKKQQQVVRSAKQPVRKN